MTHRHNPSSVDHQRINKHVKKRLCVDIAIISVVIYHLLPSLLSTRSTSRVLLGPNFELAAAVLPQAPFIMSDRRKSATPYELYTSSSSNSRFRLAGGGGDGSSVFLPPSSSNTPVRRYGAGAASFSPGSARSLIHDSSPFRRNVPFGSPGPRAAPAMSEAARSAGRASLPPNDDAGTPFGSKGSAARKRFVRRKPLKERCVTDPTCSSENQALISLLD